MKPRTVPPRPRDRPRFAPSERAMRWERAWHDAAARFAWRSALSSVLEQRERAEIKAYRKSGAHPTLIKCCTKNAAWHRRRAQRFARWAVAARERAIEAAARAHALGGEP